MTTLTINYQWRRLIVSLLDEYLEGLIFDSGGSSEIDYYNHVRSLINDLYTANGAIVSTFLEASRNSNQTFPVGQLTPVNFDTGDFDASNVSRVNVDVSAVYVVTVQIWLLGAAHVRMDCYLRVNGVSPYSGVGVAPAGTPRGFSIGRVMELQAGDYLEIVVNPIGGNASLVVTGVPPILSIGSWG